MRRAPLLAALAPLALLALVALVAGASAATAQRAPPARRARPPAGWELRADAVSADEELAAHAGVGATLPLGTYARLALVAGAGTARVDGDERAAARVDALVRVTTDPFAEHRRAFYLGAGATARTPTPRAPATALLLVVGVDGLPGRRWTPAFEVGLGAGVRVGVALRRTRPGRR